MKAIEILRKFHVLSKRLHIENLYLHVIIQFSGLRKVTVNESLEHSRSVLAMKHIDPNRTCLCENDLENPSVDLQIIIPCYNVANYIDKCILSVLSQNTKYSYRIIAIDDGSKDETANLLDKYVNDERVMVIHQENRGFSGARNRGLSKIIGRYITFLDSDDTLEPNAIENLLNAAYRDGADIVEGSFVNIVSNVCKKGIIHKNEINVQYTNLYGFPWGKVYNSRLFQKVHFPENYWFEDTIGQYILYPMARKISTIDTIVYRYLKNSSGITANCTKYVKAIDTYWITEKLLNDALTLELINENNKDLYYLKTIKQIGLNFSRTMYLGKEVRHAIFNLSCDILSKYFSGQAIKNGYKEKLIEKAIREKNYSLFVLIVV